MAFMNVLATHVAPPAIRSLCALTSSITCVFTGLHSPHASADQLADIPLEKYRVEAHHFSPELIGHVEAPLISAHGRLALITDNRRLWWLEASNLQLQALESTAGADGSVWYGCVCAHADGFVVAVSDYPDPQRNREAETPRGGFRTGPEPKGLLILGRTGQRQHLPALAVASHPPVPSFPSESSEEPLYLVPPTVFNSPIQSCVQQGSKLVLGAYGALGVADVERGTIDLVQYDYGLEFNREPLWIDASGIWFGIDEGGMGGAGLEHLASSGKEGHYSIRAQDDGDIVVVTALTRHRGRIMVGTTHGLFRLNEKTGGFSGFDFGRPWSNEMVTYLVSHQGYLWSFQGGQWLRIDTRTRRAVLYAPSESTKFLMGQPFGKGWLLSGEHGLWTYRVK